MDRGTQQTYRMYVPGLLLLATLVSLFKPQELSWANAPSWIVSAGAAVVLGAIYRVVDGRERLLGFSWHEVEEHVDAQLLRIARARRDLSQPEEAFLRARQRLRNLFYRALDADESLKSRQDGVRLSGVLVTSLVDLAGIWLVGGTINLVVAAITKDLDHAKWAGVLFGGAFIGIGLYPRSMRKHVQLIDEQLGYVEIHCAAAFDQDVETVLQGMSVPGVVSH